MHHGRSCTVEFVPEFDQDAEEASDAQVMDAGAPFRIRVRVACQHGCGQVGQVLRVRDERGSELATAELSDADNGFYLANVVLRAPNQVGHQNYEIVLPAVVLDGVLHGEVSLRVPLDITAHAAQLNAWGWPSAVAAGERFSFKVSARCSCGCALAGRPFQVLDDDGIEITAGSFGAETWRGTSALYYAEVEVAAPMSLGNHRRTLKVPAWSQDAPHEGGSFDFAIRVVEAPSQQVTIEVIDSEKRTPISGLHVLMHPYRSITDERGVARIKVAKGRYTLAISGRRYIPYRDVVEAENDVVVCAELTVEPVQDGYLRR